MPIVENYCGTKYYKQVVYSVIHHLYAEKFTYLKADVFKHFLNNSLKCAF